MTRRVGKVNILVVGDIMLDHYIVGEVERISPEAPVPVVNVKREYAQLGGCGNVVINIKSVGANVTCMSLVGTDIAGESIIKLLSDSDVNANLRSDKDFVTTQKCRVVAGERELQMLRIDREQVGNYDISGLLNDSTSIDLIVVSDYGKGVINKPLMDALYKLNKPIIVDPKPRPGCELLYDKCFLITPNEKEFSQLNHSLLNHTGYILKTMGKKGMELIGYGESLHIPSEPVEVYNVSGAGDTVVSIIAVCIAMKIDMLTSAKIANDCARYVVGKTGTSCVPKDIFKNIMEKHNACSPSSN